MSSFCQETYPSIVEKDSNKLVLITPKQVSVINSAFQELTNNKLELQKYKTTTTQLLVNYSRLESVNELLNKKNNELFISYSNALKLNDTNNKLIGYYQDELKIQKRKKTWTFFGGFTIGVATLSTTILILNK